jgi:hypothetical protein
MAAVDPTPPKPPGKSAAKKPVAKRRAARRPDPPRPPWAPGALTAHPLVVGVAQGLQNAAVVGALQAAAGQAPAAGAPRVVLRAGTGQWLGGAAPAASAPGVVSASALDAAMPPGRAYFGLVATRSVGQFGVAAASDRVRLFAGYLGGSFAEGNPAVNWQVLFLDASLSTWLVVRSDDIIYSDRVKDRTAAAGLRDYLWLRSDADIARGDHSDSPDALFLRGDFTRAGDFGPSMRGDTYSGGGLLEEALTPGCCTAHSHTS